MSGEVIGIDNHEAAREIVAKAYELLEPIVLWNLEAKTSDVIGTSGACQELSDVVTRAAHGLGITASRESHIYCHHHYTSFAPLDQPPSEDDPILCLTWGQFDPAKYEQVGQGFFGCRRDIAAYVGSFYAGAYGSQSVRFRQVTHTPLTPNVHHSWLRTVPEDLRTGAFPMGEVDQETFEALQATLSRTPR